MRRARPFVGPAVLVVGGCFQADYLEGEPCTEDRECGKLGCEMGFCGGPPADAGDASTIGDSGPGDDESSAGDEDSTTGGIDLPTSRAVDLLFVIDNSGTMGPTQAQIATSIGQLVDAFDTAGVDWRIGVTTTDHGNPYCGMTSPENGELRATSCRERLAEFVYDGVPAADVTATACLDVCGLDSITTTSPWIERIAGTSNVDVEPSEALACILPQGVTGCAFEQPLEAMHSALQRADDPGDPAYGFARADALLAVVIVTDEADCSYDPASEAVFLPEGDHRLWSDPDATSATSAVCWNGGVVCTGGADDYDSCTAADLDASGMPTEGDPVMYPIDRYLADLVAKPTYIAAIDGVPLGYEEGASQMQYSAVDTMALDAFGIDPECVSAAGSAVVPSVRVRELVERAAEGRDGHARNNFSICAIELPFLAIAQRIVERMPP